MKILVLGASGRVGRKLVEKLLADGHQVIGSTRQEKLLFDHENYSQLQLDMKQSLEEMKKKFPDHLEAIYFVSGSRGHDLLNVDLHGAVKTMKVAEEKGIKRYVMLSAMHSLNPGLFYSKKLNPLTEYYIAKHHADLYLISNTKLDYTIAQPGALIETEGSGKVEMPAEESGEVSIENVAVVLAEVLERKNTYKKVIPFIDGKVEIQQALGQDFT